MHNFVSILVCNHLEEEEKDGCFAMYCYYKCSVALPQGAVGWSAECDMVFPMVFPNHTYFLGKF